MIIVRDVFREIICNAEHFYISTYSNRIMLVHDMKECPYLKEAHT